MSEDKLWQRIVHPTRWQRFCDWLHRRTRLRTLRKMPRVIITSTPQKQHDNLVNLFLYISEERDKNELQHT